MHFFRYIAAGCMVLLLAPSAQAQQPITVERVKFAPGAFGSVITNTIKGYETIDYKLNAAAGQRMVVDLNTSNLSNYFNVIGPGADSALFVGASKGDHFDGILPSSGDWTIRVFLMRNAARRHETANYTLSIHIDGAITPPAADTSD